MVVAAAPMSMRMTVAVVMTIVTMIVVVVIVRVVVIVGLGHPPISHPQTWGSTASDQDLGAAGCRREPSRPVGDQPADLRLVGVRRNIKRAFPDH